MSGTVLQWSGAVIDMVDAPRCLTQITFYVVDPDAERHVYLPRASSHLVGVRILDS